jgi:hypothetical protein
MSEFDSPVVAKTIADQTYQHIRRDIITGKLPPGTKLGMEMLSRRYSVGVSPLREALVKLTGDALAVARLLGFADLARRTRGYDEHAPADRNRGAFAVHRTRRLGLGGGREVLL